MKAIVVLGSRVAGGEIHQELKLRLDMAIGMFGPSSIMVLSGGYTNHPDRSEAQFMADYCLKEGIPEGKIYLEEESLDTIGNGYFVRLAVDKIPGIDEVVVVSSCYHMERSEFIFRSCFANRYRLDFKHCSEFKRESDSEKESMVMARDFFRGIEPGDVSGIAAKLHKEHLLYRSE